MQLGLLLLFWCSHALAALPAQPFNQQAAHAKSKNETSNLTPGKLPRPQPVHDEQKNKNTAPKVPKTKSVTEHADHKREIPKVKSTPATDPIAKAKGTPKSAPKHQKDEATARLVTELAAVHKTGGKVIVHPEGPKAQATEATKEHAEHKKEDAKVSTKHAKNTTSHLRKNPSPAVKTTSGIAPVAKEKATSKSVPTKHKKDAATARLVTELATLHKKDGQVGRLSRYPTSTSMSALKEAEARETEAEREQKVQHALDVSALAIEGADSVIESSTEEATNAHMIARGTFESHSAIPKVLHKWIFNPLPKLVSGFSNMLR